ncbi:MAG: SMC-Scp complex subunit ScpB [Deltaproteobacteria bacterium]|nr:SMC-Scp complex subunit ScpB [Deltaproteobacteria bacterium]
METKQIKSAIEALIFAAEEPIGVAALMGILEEGTTKAAIEEALSVLTQEYASEEKGLLLREVGGGYQFVTKPSQALFLQKLQSNKPRSLSPASLETLAIVAYRQPIVRADVDTIRGVDSGGVLKTLLERGLVKIVGRREEAGQPLIYGTTPAFLELFHLKNLEELPSMKEIEQVIEKELRDKEGKTEVVASEESEGATPEEIQEEGYAFLESLSKEDSDVLAELEAKMKGIKEVEIEIFPKQEEAPEEAAPEELPAEEFNKVS